jgi:hypothetical protein
MWGIYFIDADTYLWGSEIFQAKLAITNYILYTAGLGLSILNCSALGSAVRSISVLPHYIGIFFKLVRCGYTLRVTSQTSYSPEYITPTQKKVLFCKSKSSHKSFGPSQFTNHFVCMWPSQVQSHSAHFFLPRTKWTGESPMGHDNDILIV